MIVKKLYLKNYRNYDELKIDFDVNMNIFIGNNAQGKTNILESIYVLAITKSFLGTNDRSLIKFNEECAVLKADICVDNINKSLEILINAKEKRVRINGKEVKKFRDYLSKLNVLLFSPDNIRMIKDGPASRRRFLNVEISQISSKYVRLMNDYNGLLKQRNEYIKNTLTDDGNLYLEILNEKFVSLAVDITLERKRFLDCINKYIGSIYKEITNTMEICIKYESSVFICDDREEMRKSFLDKLMNSFSQEKKYGVSLYGPHRDDFHFYLNDKNISMYGSQGQLRMAILSLILAEIPIFRDYTGQYPVLLLDDIFSELDLEKRNNLIKYFSSDLQVIITTTDLDSIQDSLLDRASVYVIGNGKVIDQKKGNKKDE